MTGRAERVGVVGNAPRGPVHLLQPELTVARGRRIEGIEEVGARNAVELHEVARQMLVHDSRPYAAVGEPAEDLARRLPTGREGHVARTDHVTVGPLHPAGVDRSRGERWHGVVSRGEDQAARVWQVGLGQ